ncbi:FusB/FusC family EF-G-binding protein [Cohnella caldifontis]|uniref:FusB/FusC family EF-G-binding protein n=1 Tax=Cohnella caldifontis TaxID=3027471 RepID=UPI0023ED6525|nr:FusB/FusC family EF-G-binding protein [Cohnella sp. YIM B05605]
MNQPFIRNHQYNRIKKAVGQLRNAIQTVSDPKVIRAVREQTAIAVSEAVPDAAEEQKRLLAGAADLATAEDCQRFADSLEPYVADFGALTDEQLRKLFPKIKKLKLPDRSGLDSRFVTYLGWTDIASNRMFLVYRLDGRYVGVEGTVTPANKKNTCFLCNRHEEVALFSAISKKRPAGASPDYYQSFGNYLCLNSETCNRGITDVSALEAFLRNLIG